MAQFLYGVIDTQREKYKPIGAVNLCDTLELELQVEMNGKAMEFVKPEFEFLVLKDDDNKVRQLVDIIFEDNKIKIRCNEQVTTCPGKTKGQLIIKDNGRVSTCLFYFIVKDTIEGAIIRSITDVQILDDLEEYVVQGFANLDEFERRIIASDASIRKLNEDMIVAEKIRDEAEKKREELKNILETKLENGEFNGQQGLQGLPGKDGIDGINGQDGADGVTPNIQVGTVTTLEAGQQAIVTKRGTDAEPIFDFAIPQGVKGEKGDTPDMTAFEKKINAQYEDIASEFDKAVANVTNGNENVTNSEIVQARGKEVNLNARLTKFDSQLEHKVSYPILDNEVGVLNITYEYGNVKRYGAIGEISIEDNTASFQNAIDSAYACGFNVYIPMGVYNILNTLYLPSRISIKGEVTTKYVYDYVYNPNDFRGSIIISKCDYLFKPKNVNSYNIQETQLNMKEIMFLNRTVGNYDKTVLFKNMNLKSSNIENVCTLDYSIILMGWLSGVTTIKNCNFQGIRYYFIYSLKEAPNDFIDELMVSDNVCLVDSYILDSYINGKANTTGAILFKGQGIAHSTISNNFIDYAKEVFSFTSSNKASIISNNTFDVCYRIFKGKINSLNIYGNSFNNCRYNSSYWSNLSDEEMLNNEWGVLEPNSGFTDTNITNNSAYQSDFLFKFVDNISIYNITFNNNMLHCYLSEEPFQYKAMKGKGELDQTNIFLGDLMYKEYTTLPNPSLTITGGVLRISSFNGHIIRYKNRMLYNNNGVWCNMDGSEFIDS